MSPVYDTRVQKKAEVAFAVDISRALDLSMIQTPDFSHDDWVAWKKRKMIARCELKCREYLAGHFEDYMIDAAKIDNCRALAKKHGVPFWLFVRWINEDWYLDYRLPEGEHYPRRMGGRTDRGDPDDWELQEFIPNSVFRVMRTTRKP